MLRTAAAALTLALVSAGPALATQATATTPIATPALPAVGMPAVNEAAQADPAASCARKVKVVYQGYGEASRAGCAASTVVTR